jgi:5-methylcytosine-specific restriction endonuclease McrA
VSKAARIKRERQAAEADTQTTLASVPDPRPPIPDPLKREVRQRCGFGCVICGKPLYQYDHVVPYTVTKDHTVDNLVLLCDGHHREKTAGLLPLAAVRKAYEAPRNIQTGESHPYGLHYSGTSCEALIGSVRAVLTSMADGQLAVPLLVDDTPLVAFRVEDERLLLTAQLFGSDNALLVQIVDNELVYSVSQWDVELVGKVLTVRAGPGDIFVQLTFEPPSCIAINRGKLWRNGLALEISPLGLTNVSGSNGLHNLTLDGAPIAIAVGNPPEGCVVGVYLASDTRAEYPSKPDSEARVRRIVNHAEGQPSSS